MTRHRQQFALVGAALVLVAAILACGPGGGETETGAPSVTITSPASGTTVQVGQNVQVSSMAAADAGIARVELLVNGQVIRTDMPPSGQPTTFAIIQPWMPIAAGDVTVSVVAYDTAGTPSPPATITLHVEAGVSDVTPTPEADVSGPGGCTLNGAYAADVTIPDDTQLAPGTAFVKTWRIRNSGTCDWGAGFTLVFVSGDQMGAPGSVTVPPTAAGSTVDVSVNMVAPTTPGTYRGNWRLRSDTGQLFGTTVYVRIVVPSPITPTPTATPTTPPPTGIPNLRATLQADGSVRFTWDDLPTEAQYRYEFSFVAGSTGFANASTLPANTTSWTSSVLSCGGNGGFTLIALAADSSEIARGTANFTTAACVPQTAILTPIASLSGALSTEGCGTGNYRAGIAPAGNGIRAAISFDVDDLNDASSIVAATLDLSGYSLTGNPFEFLHPLRVEQVSYSSLCDDPNTYSGAAITQLAQFSDTPGLASPVDVRTALANYLAAGDPATFQIRMRFEHDDAGAAYASMIGWSAVRLVVVYQP